MRFLCTHPRSDRRARSDASARSPRGDRRGIQIGPRIRIGGSVGKVGQNVKNAVTKAATDTGHAVGDVASNPWVQGALATGLAVTGVGAPAAAAMMAATKGGGALLKKGGNIGDGLREGVKGAAMGYGAAKAGSAIKGGMSLLSGKGVGGGGGGGAAGDVMDAAGEDGGGSSWWDKAKGIFSGGGSDGEGNFGMLGDLGGKAGSVMGGGGGGSMMDKGLLIAAIADAAAQKKKQGELQDKALGYATDAYSAKQPLRSRGLELLQDEAAPDLSSIFANPQNKYSKTVPALQVGTRVPMGQPVLPSGGTY